MADLILHRSELTLPRSATPDTAAANVIDPRIGAVPVQALVSTSYSLIDTVEGLQALAPEWNALFAVAGRPEQVFQTFAWNWHWSRHYLACGRFKGGPRPAIVAGRREGRLVLLMPLVVERVAGLRQLAWMGEPVSQYGDVLALPAVADVATLAAAWRFAVAATRADLAKLRKVRADAVVAPLLAHLGAPVTATEEAPYLDFSRASDCATYAATLSAKGRKNRRRNMRRLLERGPVTFEQHAADVEAAQLAGYAVLLKRAWLRTRDQISLAMADDRFLAFFTDVASMPHEQLGCQVLGLRSVNEIGALQIILECKGQRFLHVAVYASKFEKSGVGGLLLEHARSGCCKDGMTRLDLLAPRHEYKMEFADGTVEVRDYAVALTLAGRAYARSYLGVRRRLKAAVENMPAPARRAFASAVALVKR